VTDRVTVFDRALLLTPFERFAPGRLVVRDGVIEAAGAASDIAIPAGAGVIDLSNGVIVPGFIDPHIHGAGGADVMDGTYDALNTVSRAIARNGVTAFLPTTLSAPPDRIGNAVESLGKLIASGQFEGATPLGIHLEGPFLNPDKRGAHPAAHVLAPDSVNVGLLAEWVRRSNGTIKLVTFAPELDGANAIVREASTSGFTLAMGHSNATMSEAVHAIVRGVRYAVHTFNAMRGFTHREPGIVGAILSDDRVYTEVIADGVHVAPTTVRILARCKGPDRVLLVTDATAAAGMPDGTYTLGDQRVRVIKGVCRNAQGQLAGSALRLDVGLRNFMMWTGASLEHAVRSVTVNPARALGLKGHGVIEPGARADLAILDDHDTVVATFVGGRQVFAREV
jgi:N-acetylglucosamine-6-phosphate deacetylase